MAKKTVQTDFGKAEISNASPPPPNYKKQYEEKLVAEKEAKRGAKKPTKVQQQREAVRKYWEEVKRRDDAAKAEKAKRDQLSLFEEKKQGRGRPSKYNEETRTVTFRLPVSVIKKLRVFAALHDQTPGDVLTELIKPLNVPGCK